MAFEDKKFVGSDALSELSTKVKTELGKKTDKVGALTNVSYDTTNKKLTKTTQGAHDPVTTDIVTTATLKTDMGIADFDGTFSSLKSKPTTISGYGITDAKVQNSTVTIGSNSVTALTQDDVSSTYDSSGTSPVDGKAVAAALGTLDVESVGGAGKYISAISETDGKISATVETMDSTPTSNSTKAVTSDGIYEYVNSSVSTNTAYFIGTFDSVEELEAYSGIITNNDYAFVTSTDSSGNTLYNRYKYNGSTHTWSFEYALNNSSFTSAQWATIQSGLTSSDKTKLDGIQSGANKTIVDAAMSASSTNPVQNKVVNTALARKQDTLTFDSTPTQSSTNPVTSAGIYTDQVRQDALEAQDRAALIEQVESGAKNRANITQEGVKSANTSATWDGYTTTFRGVTFTVNADGTVTVQSSAETRANDATLFLMPLGDAFDMEGMVLSGCPSGGGNTKYELQTVSNTVRDYGDGVQVTISGNNRIAIVVRGTYTETTPIVFRPMICTKAEWDISNAFVPYGKTNAELTSDTSTLFTENTRQETEISVVANAGAKNLLNFDAWKDVGVTRCTKTISGNSITITSTGSDSFTWYIAESTTVQYPVAARIPVEAGKTYRLSWTADNNNTLNHAIYGNGTVGRPDNVAYRGEGSGYLDYTAASDVTFITFRLGLYDSGKTTTFSNVMIRPAAITDATFQPYARSNPALTAEMDYVVNAGAKNLLKFRTDVTNSSAGNVYARINSDGTISVGLTSGTTATAQLVFTLGAITKYRDRKLILSGCPAGGNYTSGYALYIANDGSTAQADTGSGATLPIVTGVTSSVVALIVRSGTTISSELTFQPMVRDAAITDATFQPYARSNPALTAEIDVVTNAGVKNLLNPDDYIENSTGGLTITETGTGTYKITGTPSRTVDVFTTQSGTFDRMYGLEAGKTYTISGLPTGNGLICRIDVSKNNSGSWDAQIISNLTLPQTFTVPSDATGLYIRYRVTTSAMIPSGGISLEPMIRPAAITDQTFQPYARTNRELTVLTDEDRAALVEIVDGGDKNKFLLDEIGKSASTHGTVIDQNGVKYTVNADKTISVLGTATSGAWIYFWDSATNAAKNFIEFFDGKHVATINRGSIPIILFYTIDGGSSVQIDDGTILPNSNGTTAVIGVQVNKNSVVDPEQTIYPMICTEAAWKISQTFQPYRPSWQEMWDAIQALQSSGTRALTMQMHPTENIEPEEEER